MHLRRLLFIAIALSFAVTAASANPSRAPLLLISLDGFRWDYCARFSAETPNLRRLAAEGVSARALIPVFPSNTFPNHYSIVTGLRPANHGIVNNDFFDAGTGLFFHGKQAASNHEPRWWGGEPIWITAERQGRRAACYFWPGSEVPLAGVRPTFWKPYDYATPFEQRLDELIGWLKLPGDQQPAITTFYLEETNSAGHAGGPESPQLAAAVRLLDGRVGAILARLHAEKIEANIVIVSDHGMTPLSVDRVLVLDDYIDMGSVQVDFEGPVVGLRPANGDVDALLKALVGLPRQAKVCRAEDLPPHLHVVPGPKVPPVWILADEGWHVERRTTFNAVRAHYNKGEHGYDPALPNMRGILIGWGSAFKSGGLVVEPVENIQLYNLFCAILGLVPARNDGDQRLVHSLLR